MLPKCRGCSDHSVCKHKSEGGNETGPFPDVLIDRRRLHITTQTPSVSSSCQPASLSHPHLPLISGICQFASSRSSPRTECVLPGYSCRTTPQLSGARCGTGKLQNDACGRENTLHRCVQGHRTHVFAPEHMEAYVLFHTPVPAQLTFSPHRLPPVKSAGTISSPVLAARAHRRSQWDTAPTKGLPPHLSTLTNQAAGASQPRILGAELMLSFLNIPGPAKPGIWTHRPFLDRLLLAAPSCGQRRVVRPSRAGKEGSWLQSAWRCPWNAGGRRAVSVRGSQTQWGQRQFSVPLGSSQSPKPRAPGNSRKAQRLPGMQAPAFSVPPPPKPLPVVFSPVSPKTRCKGEVGRKGARSSPPGRRSLCRHTDSPPPWNCVCVIPSKMHKRS